MTIFTIEVDGTLIKRVKANDHYDKSDMIYFSDEDNNTVASVVKKPGMTVMKEGHDPDEE